jgi:hypothetical protein
MVDIGKMEISAALNVRMCVAVFLECQVNHQMLHTLLLYVLVSKTAQHVITRPKTQDGSVMMGTLKMEIRANFLR